MHQLARRLIERHSVQALTQWDTHRTDWLLGTTLRAPHPARTYLVDGVPVARITLPFPARRRLAPWVLAYPALQGPALRRIAALLATEIEPWAAGADLIHNCRIGREGLSFASLTVARRHRIPFVLTPVHHPRWNTWLHRYYHHLYRQADAVIALTTAERDAMVTLGVKESRVFVTGMGPILAETHDGARFRAQHGLEDFPLILFLGQKYPYKGIAVLTAAAKLVWARHPDARFFFIGPETPYSRRLFRAESDSRIRSLDTVPLQDKTDALAACDILCLPSREESFGAVFLEAWSFGKPVVGVDSPAVRAVVDDGHNGLLAPREPGAIAERLILLLDRPELRAQFGQRGKEKVAARYSWPYLAEQTEQVYRAVLARI